MRIPGVQLVVARQVKRPLGLHQENHLTDEVAQTPDIDVG